MEDIEFLSGFCCLKFKQIARNWVWKNNNISVEPAMWCSHCRILEIFNSENGKIKECVHTGMNSTGYTSYNQRTAGSGYFKKPNFRKLKLWKT